MPFRKSKSQNKKFPSRWKEHPVPTPHSLRRFVPQSWTRVHAPDKGCTSDVRRGPKNVTGPKNYRYFGMKRWKGYRRIVVWELWKWARKKVGEWWIKLSTKLPYFEIRHKLWPWRSFLFENANCKRTHKHGRDAPNQKFLTIIRGKPIFHHYR